MYIDWKKSKATIVIFISVWFSFTATAQQRDTTLERSIDEVTVSARRMPRQLSSTVPVQAISGEKIKALGLQNMADAVRRFSGTTVRDYGGIGGMKTVSVRSLGAHHTTISYDDVAVSNCQAGQIDIGRFSLDNVAVLSLSVGEEEEILRSARMAASAAVLSIRTEVPNFMLKRKYTVQANIRAGSFGQVNPFIRASLKTGKRTFVSLDGNYLRADGTYPFTLENGAETTHEKRYNSDIVAWHSEANLYHSFRDSAELNAKVYYFDSERGLPGSVILYNNESRERLWDENFFAQACYKKNFSPKWSMQAQAKYNYSWNKYEDTDVKYEGGRQTDLNTQNEYYASATAQFNPSKIFSFSLAQDGAINTLENNINDNPSPIRYTSLTALRAHLKWHGLEVSGTVLNTFITEHVENGDTPDDRKKLTPSVSLIYKPFEQYSFNVRTLYKKTFRVPTFNDLYYLRIGNTGLRPELADEYNVGITWSGTPFRFLDYITLTVDGYYNEVKDKIVAFPSTYVWKMSNFGKVRITGFDANVAIGVPIAQHIQAQINGSYTYQHAIDVTDEMAKNYKDQIPYTPRHSGNASLTLQMPWVNVSYTLVAVGERYYMKQNLSENRINSYIEHNIALSRLFRFHGCDMRLQAECVNFTNEQYDIIKYYPMPGRSFRATISIKL